MNANEPKNSFNTPSVLYEDKTTLVINKPAGWIVNSADTTKDQPVIQKWVEETYDFYKNADADSDFHKRAGIVHRLDKETSGCLIIAKTPDAFAELQRQFKDREIHKKYTALLHGKLKEKKGEIVAAVGRLPWRRDRFGILPGGRDSKSSYEVKNEYLHGKDMLTLVEFTPETGRTHQIRIHAKYIGHPLVADQFYAGRKTARNDRKWCPRLFLHASSIEFVSPVGNKKQQIEAPLAADLAMVLSKLELQPSETGDK